MTKDEIMRVYLTARNALAELSIAADEGRIPAEEMDDLEHKFWALSMYADQSRLDLRKLMEPQHFLEAAE